MDYNETKYAWNIDVTWSDTDFKQMCLIFDLLSEKYGKSTITN